jgi:hypothetical protein
MEFSGMSGWVEWKAKWMGVQTGKKESKGVYRERGGYIYKVVRLMETVRRLS